MKLLSFVFAVVAVGLFAMTASACPVGLAVPLAAPACSVSQFAYAAPQAAVYAAPQPVAAEPVGIAVQIQTTATPPVLSTLVYAPSAYLSSVAAPFVNYGSSFGLGYSGFGVGLGFRRPFLRRPLFANIAANRAARLQVRANRQAVRAARLR